MLDYLLLNLIDALFPAAVLLIGLVVTWLAAQFTRLTGIEIEARHRQVLQSALENGVRYAINLLRQRGAPVTPANVTQLAAEYVRQSVPDAVRKFRLGDSKLVDLLTPKLPVLTEDQARDRVEKETGQRPTNVVRER